MVAPKYRIESDGIKTHIYIDDKEITNIVQFKLEQKAGEITTLELYIMPLEITTDENAGSVKIYKVGDENNENREN